MGTRADFYVGRGKDAEWLGSIGRDGYPDGIDDDILGAKTQADFRHQVAEHMATRDDWTKPEDGWPWPWNDSNATDYAYAFDGDKVHFSCFGGNWFDPTAESNDDGEYELSYVAAIFPDMSDRKAVTMGPRSGVIVIG